MKRYLLSTALLASVSALCFGSAFAADEVSSSNGAGNISSDNAIAAAPSGSTVSVEKGGACGGGSGCGPKNPLTEAQIQQLRALRDRYSVDNATKKAQLQVLHHQLMDQLGAATIDKSAVLATQAKINSLRDDLSNAKIGMMLDASSVFTPEQREHMHQRMLRGGFRGHHGGHHGRGGHGGHGGWGGQRGFHGGPGGPGSASAPETDAPAPAEG
jgi:Spy/CpxP family protein refolding chaperone